jgi:hypothetical protein
MTSKACTLVVTTALAVSACSDARTQSHTNADGVVSMGILPAPNQTAFFDYPVDGVDLGQGWHQEAVTKAVATCIDFTPRRDSGQEQSMDLTVVNDNSALMDALDVSAEAQFKSIGYSVSGKARFAKETEVRSTSVNVVAHARVMNGVEYAAPAEAGRPSRVDLTPYYRDLARRSRVAFEQECGDGFVAAVYSGAELAAVLSVDEFDRKTRASLETSLSGSVGGFSAAGTVEGKKGDAKTMRKVRVTFHQTGGSGSPMPTSQEDLVAAVGRLPALAAGEPHDYRIQVQSYRTLPGYPPDVREDQARFRQTLATSHGRLLTLRHIVVDALELEAGADYADAHKDQRPSAIRERMQALHDELTKAIRDIHAVSKRCTFYDDDMGPPQTDAGPAPCGEEKLNLRDDSAYRVRLPVLKSTGVDLTDRSDVAAAVIDQHIRAVSRRRCERDIEDPGCLPESEIEEWKKKLAG